MIFMILVNVKKRDDEITYVSVFMVHSILVEIF